MLRFHKIDQNESKIKHYKQLESNVIRDSYHN